MFVKNPGTAITLNGVDLIMPPLSLGMLEQMDETAFATLTTGSDFKPARMKLFVDVVHAALKRNYPDMQRDQVADGLNMGNLRQVMSALLLSSSGPAKDPASGEASEIGRPSGLISSLSSLPIPDGQSSTAEST